MTTENVVQQKLISVAMKILDLCSPMSDIVLRKYLEDRLIQNSTDSVLDFVRMQLNNCHLEMNDDTFSIIYKLRDTIVLLELLHKSELVSEEEIVPIVIECSQLLDILQNNNIVN
jgi:hypothetical protein